MEHRSAPLLLLSTVPKISLGNSERLSSRFIANLFPADENTDAAGQENCFRVVTVMSAGSRSSSSRVHSSQHQGGMS